MSAFSLYIHWPFCLSKCPYCDFNSHVYRSVEEKDWVNALIQELERYKKILPHTTVKTIFFGGGTPSLMNPKTVEAIIKTAHKLWVFHENIEITLEANPNSSEVNHFENLQLAGINRISIGIQALNDKDLKTLGRHHTAKEGIQAIERALHIFKRVSFDLIYSRPHQTLKEWKEELSRALAFDTKHLSLYQLTIEPGTAFYTYHKRGDLVLPDDDLSINLFNYTNDCLTRKGLPPYEISNYAPIGEESLHNLSYWRYEDYLGVGPGAHSRIAFDNQRWAIEHIRTPELWYQSIIEKKTGEKNKTSISPKEQIIEKIMMGLRLKEGIIIDDISPIEWKEIINKKKLNLLLTKNFLEIKNGYLRATPQGQRVLNSLIEQIIIL